WGGPATARARVAVRRNRNQHLLLPADFSAYSAYSAAISTGLRPRSDRAVLRCGAFRRHWIRCRGGNAIDLRCRLAEDAAPMAAGAPARRPPRRGRRSQALRTARGGGNAPQQRGRDRPTPPPRPRGG